MTDKLSRWQAIVLGIVVLTTVGTASAGLLAIAARQGLWNESFVLTVGFPEVHDVMPGTPVRIRGVDAGQVIRIEYPEEDGPSAQVTLHLRIDARYRSRIHADAAVQIQQTGLLGSKVVAIQPGQASSGPCPPTLIAKAAPDLAATAEKLAAITDDVHTLVRDIRTGKGTLGKLATDDQLYEEVQSLVRDTRRVTAQVQSEVAKVGPVMRNSQATLQSVQRTTDAFERSRIGRQFIDSPAAVLVHPDCRKEMFTYNTVDLFEPGTAILTDAGRWHLRAMVDWLKAVPKANAEVVVAAVADPNDPRTETIGVAGELTRKQAEAVTEFLKAEKATRISWWTRRKITAIGLAHGPNPAADPDQPLPPNYIQIVLFTPTV